MFKHFLSESCIGEKCKCGENATHKVGEQISSSDPSYGQRHEFTAYVCCECFCKLLGTYEWCGLTKKIDFGGRLCPICGKGCMILQSGKYPLHGPHGNPCKGSFKLYGGSDPLPRWYARKD